MPEVTMAGFRAGGSPGAQTAVCLLLKSPLGVPVCVGVPILPWGTHVPLVRAHSRDPVLP